MCVVFKVIPQSPKVDGLFLNDMKSLAVLLLLNLLTTPLSLLMDLGASPPPRNFL